MYRQKLFLVLILALIASTAKAQLPNWSYDPGPDITNPMGKELVDIVADIPNMPALSNDLIGRKQKFRPAFGPIPWRMRTAANSVKILFMGQDGTHIAEAAGRPATAGFGGRAQDFAKYFGVSESAAFINAYAFTIKGQYGIYDTPYIFRSATGESLRFSNFVDNKLWLMSNHLQSPIVKWRNNLIDWIIRNNRQSMKLIVLFGGAARDAISSFAKSKGAKVYARMEGLIDSIQIPMTKEEYAGGNNTFPSLYTKEGRDLYASLLGEKPDYTSRGVQNKLKALLETNLSDAVKKMLFNNGGKKGSGLIDMAQLGGYDLDTMSVNGVKTRSLKGLPLSDGTVIENDILVITLPHPSSLSRTVMEADSYGEGLVAASRRVMRDVKILDKYKENGWAIKADPGFVNLYERGEKYKYGRTDIGTEYYDFGTPANRMVSRSSAKRMSRNANVVIIGTRDRAKFSMSAIKEMTHALPAIGINEAQLFLARPSALDSRYTYDSGPGIELAKVMKKNLDLKTIFTPKSEIKCIDNEGNITKKLTLYMVTKPVKEHCLATEKSEIRKMDFDTDGIFAYNVKSHPDVADFGHYRGDVSHPKIIILADPSGYDSILTSKALTGNRGQLLQGLFNDLGIGDDYLVIRTVPFAMEQASQDEWNAVLTQTNNYRKSIFKLLLSKHTPDLIIADGKYAGQALKSLEIPSGVKAIKLSRSSIKTDHVKDIKLLAKKLGPIYSNFNTSISLQKANIPRSHLSFYARVWEGTSGDRVITSSEKKYRGQVFAIVAPAWAYEQKIGLSAENKVLVNELQDIMYNYGFIMPYESISNYLRRISETQVEVPLAI